MEDKRTCIVCGKTYPLTEKYWKKTRNEYTQQCRKCIQKKAKSPMLSDEELERRYQRVLKNTTDRGLVYKTYEFRIGDRVKVIRIDPEDKFGLYKEIRGTIISKTRDFIVVKQSNGVRECFRYIDIAVGDYEVKGV